jgi:serine/threonine-protein kinase
VFVAEDTELGRHIALKEIQSQHADRTEYRQRFVLEAEITGGLEHPGIVPVYGLGTYADGRPFYAMRFIKGDNLRDALRRFHSNEPRKRRFEALAFRELLGRFVDVYQAVAYAHSRGVLHRDLKPGNIMLGKYGETLVVDWGLAKPVGRAESIADEDVTLRPRSGTESSHTVAGQAIGTPAYMAPEQAAGLLDKLGPASDIYSLGATLYEVLTGQASFTQADLAAVQRGDFVPPRRVVADVPRALEAICLKAMALKPDDRYASALDVAVDVEHWLADEPVSVHTEPAVARARRWARNHPGPVAGIAAAVLVGVVGLIASSVLLGEKNQQLRAANTKLDSANGELTQTNAQLVAARTDAEEKRDLALAARKRTREALDAMVSGATGDALTVQKELSPEQKTFLESVLGYYQEFAAEPGEDRESRERLAMAHYRLGTIRRRLGQAQDGAKVFRRCVELYEKLATDFPAVPEYRLKLARSRNKLGDLAHDLRRLADAETEFRQAIELLEMVAADFPSVPDYRSELSESHYLLGNCLSERRRVAEAAAEYRRAIELREKLAADFPAAPDYRSDLAASLSGLANLSFVEPDRGTEAEPEHRRAIELVEKLVADFPAKTSYRSALASIRYNLGVLLHLQPGRRAEAEPEYRRAVQLFEKLAADFPAVPSYRQYAARSRNNLGELLHDLGRADAEAEIRRAIELLEKLAADVPAVPDYRSDLAGSRNGLGNLLRDKGRLAEAEAEYRTALSLREKLAAEFPAIPCYRQQLLVSRLRLADLKARSGNHVQAIAEAEVVAGAKDVSAEILYEIAYVFSRSSVVAKDDAALADRYATRAVELLQQAFVKGYTDVAQMLQDADFAPLRSRPAYIDLLWDLADGPPLAKQST